MPIVNFDAEPLTEPGLYDVFTPTSIALRHGVPRPEQSAAIRSALLVPGRQLLVYGRSGSGKSTVLLREIERARIRHITMRCTPESTFEDLLEGIRLQLGLPIEHDYPALLHRTVYDLGMAGLSLVFEDVHLLPREERSHVINAAKIFSDLGTRFSGTTMILIAVVDSPEELGLSTSEQSSRIAEVHVPLMTERELASVVTAGAEVLGVVDTGAAQTIAAYSGGLPGVAHQLALDAFLAASTLDRERPLAERSARAVTAALEKRLHTMAHGMRERFGLILESARRDDDYRSVLDALGSFDPEGIRLTELHGLLRDELGGLTAERTNRSVARLTESSTGAALERFKPEGVRFSDPLLHSYWSIARSSTVSLP